MTSVNEAKKYIAKQEEIEQLGKVLPRIIAEIAETPKDGRPIFFIEIDIKDDFWRMIC